MTKEYLVTPPPYNLRACNDFYDLAFQNAIPPAALEAISKLARAWTRGPRFGGEDLGVKIRSCAISTPLKWPCGGKSRSRNAASPNPKYHPRLMPWAAAHQKGRFFRERCDDWIPVYVWMIPQLSTSWHVMASEIGAGVGQWWPVTGSGARHWLTLLTCAQSRWGKDRVEARQHGGQRMILGSDCLVFARLVEFRGGTRHGETWVEMSTLADESSLAEVDRQAWSEKLVGLGWSSAVRPGLHAADIERRIAAVLADDGEVE